MIRSYQFTIRKVCEKQIPWKTVLETVLETVDLTLRKKSSENILHLRAKLTAFQRIPVKLEDFFLSVGLILFHVKL